MNKIIPTLVVTALLAPLVNADLADAVANAGALLNDREATIEPAQQTQLKAVMPEAGVPQPEDSKDEASPLMAKQAAYAKLIADRAELRDQYKGRLGHSGSAVAIDFQKELDLLKARFEARTEDPATSNSVATETAATTVVTKPEEVELKPESMSATESLPAKSAKAVEELSFSDRAAALIQRLKQAPEKTQQ